MKISLLTAIFLFSGYAFAADSEALQSDLLQQQVSQLKCDTPSMLLMLAQTVQTSNKLNPNLGYDFDNVQTINANYRHDKVASMKCMASLKLFDKDSQSVTDSLVVIYGLKSNSNGGYSFSFEPQR